MFLFCVVVIVVNFLSFFDYFRFSCFVLSWIRMDGRESEDKIKERVLERIDKFSFLFACSLALIIVFLFLFFLIRSLREMS